MKRYGKQLAILVLQLLLFYVFPLMAGSDNAIGMVLLMIAATFILAVIMGAVTAGSIRFLYPVLVSAMFIPSVFLFYNESALVHAVWYLVISLAGVSEGALIRVGSRKR